MPDATLYAIDQFALRGGKILAFVDPYSEAEAMTPQPGGRPPADTASNLPKLFGAWGIEMPADTIVGDLAAARRVQVPTEGGHTRVAAIDSPFWLALGQRNFDQESPVVAPPETITIASPRHLGKTTAAAIGVPPPLKARGASGPIPAAPMTRPGPLAPPPPPKSST